MITRLFTLLLMGLSCLNSFAQPVLMPKAIGESGCFALLPEELNHFEITDHPDGLSIYVGEVTVPDGTIFGVRAFRRAQASDELTDSALNVLQLETERFIAGAGWPLIDCFELPAPLKNLQKGMDAHILAAYMRQCVDKEGYVDVVKGWISAEYVCILYLRSVGEYLHPEHAEAYLNGFFFNP